ncbi:hypothetical protein GOD74_12120 [Sinorhizobium medicae]|nr:hypothetical protein [Sinorhizobium medicae]
MRSVLAVGLGCVLLAGSAMAQSSDSFLAKSRAVTVSSYPSDGVVLGQGWDSFLERKTGGACVTGGLLSAPGQEISYKLDKIEDIEQIFNSLQISASAKFKALGVGAEVSSSFSKSLRVDSRALNMMAVVKIDRGGAFLAPHFALHKEGLAINEAPGEPAAQAATPPDATSAQNATSDAGSIEAGGKDSPTQIEWTGQRTTSGGGLRLTDQAIAALKLDFGDDLKKPSKSVRPVNFRRICGDQFVAAIHTGGELLGVLNIMEKSREKKEALAISLKVKGMTAEGSVSLNTSLTELQKNNGLRFDSYQRGGNPSILVTNLDEFVSKVRSFASLEQFVPHPYTINTMQYSSLENWPNIDDPSRETEYLNQLANLYARFSQLKTSYDEVIVNILSPAVKIETLPDTSVRVTPVRHQFDLQLFGGAEEMHRASENTHQLLNVYADHLESCFLKNDCKIEEELALQSAKLAVASAQVPLNIPATDSNVLLPALSALLHMKQPVTQAIPSAQPAVPLAQAGTADAQSQNDEQLQLDSISKVAVKECDQFDATVSVIDSTSKLRRMLKSDVAQKLTSMALSFGAETALSALRRGENLFAPVNYNGDIVYCAVKTAETADEHIAQMSRRLSPFALYYQLVAQLPPTTGEIPYSTLIDTTDEARKLPDGKLEVVKKDEAGNVLPIDDPRLTGPILRRGDDAIRWWLVTERLLPISKSFCDEKYGHPMCFSFAELREIAETVTLNLTFDLLVNPADFTPPPPPPRPAPKPKQEYRNPRWDGPCPHNPTICI